MAQLRISSKNVNTANLQDSGLAIINDELAIDPSEITSDVNQSWNTFRNAVVSRDSTIGEISINIPNDNGQYDDLSNLVDLIVANMNYAGDTTAQMIFYLVGDVVDDRNFAYLVKSNGTNAYEKVKLNNKWVQDGLVVSSNTFIGESLIKSNDATGIDNMKLSTTDGTEYLEFSNKSLSEDPLTVGISNNVVIATVAVAQIDFTTGYVGDTVRYRNGTDTYIGVLGADGSQVTFTAE